MLHIPALWYFDILVIYPHWFPRVKFVMMPYTPTPCFVQQYLWSIAIQAAVGCYNLWAEMRCLGGSPLGGNRCGTWLFPITFLDFIHVFTWFPTAILVLLTILRWSMSYGDIIEIVMQLRYHSYKVSELSSKQIRPAPSRWFHLRMSTNECRKNQIIGSFVASNFLMNFLFHAEFNILCN